MLNFENILISGATGNSAFFFLKELEKKEFKKKISVICRNKSKNEYFKKFNLNFNILNGDIEDRKFLEGCFENIDTVLHLATPENSKNIVEIGSLKKVKWFILVHSTMIYSKNLTNFIRNRIQLEKEILENNSNITILRPTMVYGSPGDINMSRLIKYIDKYKILPVFGNGENLLQPIFVRDLSNAYFNVIKFKEKTFNKSYNLAGKEPISYINILKIISKKLKKKTIFINLPIFLSVFLIKIINFIFFDKNYPLNTSQVERLTENKTFNYSNAEKDFLFYARSFEDGIGEQIRDYKNSDV